ncbi:MAG: NUDIX domain-containing protein [Bacteroidota bacterium]
MTEAHIQPVALCVFRRDDTILVKEQYDPVRKETYFQPIGGKLRHGEYSWESIRRAIKTEFGEEIRNLSFIGPMEEVSPPGKANGHEIVFMFEGEFSNQHPYLKKQLPDQGKSGNAAVWMPLQQFRRKKMRLYPKGLLDFLEAVPSPEHSA